METEAKLTNREAEIAERIAWGASQKEVANDLGISKFTVDNTLRKIYAKLHIGKINELSAWWFCTTFNISFSLSPLQKSIVAVCLLCLVTFSEIISISDYCRYRVGRSKAKTELVARRGSRLEYDFNPIAS